MKEHIARLKRSTPAAEPAKQGSAAHSGGRLLAMKGLPVVLVVAAMAVLWLLFGEHLLPSTEVELASVVVKEMEAASAIDSAGAEIRSDPQQDWSSAAAMFQASGWFEAGPYVHRATALASGVIASVEVLEGASVRKGEVLVKLIDEDARLELASAEAAAAAAVAAVAASEADQESAAARLQTAARRVQAAEGRLLELADLDNRAQRLGTGTLPEQEVAQAALRRSTQRAQVAVLQAELVEREADVRRLAEQHQVLLARQREAQSRVEMRQLALERMSVRAPVDGIVQRLMAAPGQKKMLTADQPESATVAWLFVPSELQARIDVPLAEAAGLSVSQPVILQTEFLPGSEFRGRVARIVGEADMQRNTLQAKVVLEDPDPRLRPEMLCRAKFLAFQGAQTGTQSMARQTGRQLQVLLPEAAAVRGPDATVSAWVLDGSRKRVELRQLQHRPSSEAGFIEVTSGLKPGEIVVLRPPTDLNHGDRIRPIVSNF